MATEIEFNTDGYMVLDATRTSKAYAIKDNFVAIQFVWTDGYGTIKMQESWDRESWKATQLYAADGYQTTGIDVNGDGYETLQYINTAMPFIRVKYELISGSGGLNFYVRTKQANFWKRISGKSCWKSFFPFNRK